MLRERYSNPILTRWRALPRGYTFGVLLPFFLIVFYVGVWQTPRFASRTTLSVEQDDTLSAVPSLDLGLLSLGSSAEQTDALLVQSFLHSQRLFMELDARHDLRGHWADSSLDWLTRLGHDAGIDDVLDLYRQYLIIDIDPDSQILSVEFQAYAPEFAQRVLADIVDSSERFINDVSQNLARTQISFVEGELERAHERVKEAAENLMRFQAQADTLNPEAEAMASMEILGGLQARKAALETELSTMQTYLNDDAPDVVATRSQIQAIDEQISRERRRQTGQYQDESRTGLNRKLVNFKEAQLSAELAADIYKIGLQTLETTRLEASRKGKFVVQIDPPHLPDSPQYPDVLRHILLAFLGLHVAYFLLRLVHAAVMEHTD